MTDFERIKILTGERDEELVEVVLEDATDWVLAYTGRKKMIPELKKTVRDRYQPHGNRGGIFKNRCRGILQLR